MHWNAKTFWSLRWNVLNWCFRHALKFCLLIQCVCSCSLAATHCGESDIQPMSSKQANNELLPLSLYCIGQEHKVRHEYPCLLNVRCAAARLVVDLSQLKKLLPKAIPPMLQFGHCIVHSKKKVTYRRTRSSTETSLLPYYAAFIFISQHYVYDIHARWVYYKQLPSTEINT